MILRSAACPTYQAIAVGTRQRFFTAVKKANGDPIVTGVVNYYVKAKSGTNIGKWWRDSDQTWQVAKTANPMTHDDDGHWGIDLAGSPFAEGDRYLEYLQESGQLHIPDSRHLIGSTTGNGVGSVKQLLNVTSGGVPVQGASCEVSSDAAQQNRIVGPVYTDPNGDVYVWLDPGNYFNTIKASGHTFSGNPYPFTVSAP